MHRTPLRLARSPRATSAALLLTAALCCTGPAFAAVTVQVEFLTPERYADAGSFGREREGNLQHLAAHLQRLAEKNLADGQSLRIEVLDVDLAGRSRPLGTRSDVRLLEGGADWPRISLRYVLESPGDAAQRGEDQLADLNYLGRRLAALRDEPLPYEKALLDAWFERRFGSGTAR